MPARSKRLLAEIFTKLLDRYGPQHWWPGDSPFEVMVGAILTQNTNWTNVERAIQNLKKEKVLDLKAMLDLEEAGLAQLIRPAGYFNVKARRLRAFLQFLQESFAGDIAAMREVETASLREQLLGIKGIGPETADSILLYALHHPIFVVDAYTYRVLTRHFLIPEESDYHSIQEFVTEHVPAQVEHYNEYHALLVMVGKDFCKPRPRCETCPLNGVNW